MRYAILTRCLLFGAAVVLTLASCGGRPAPSAAPGQGAAGGGAERLLLSEAVEKAQAHLARLGYPDAQLWQLEAGLELRQDGRAVWKLRLCHPASQRDILYNFEYAQEDQRAVVLQGEMPEPCTPLPLADIAPPEQVAARNPQIWQLVAEKEQAAQQLLADIKEKVGAAAEQAGFPGAPEKPFQVKVSIGLAPFTGPSATYEHGRDAWVVTVDYPTEVDEQGRVVIEGCNFWAALDSGEPLYDECAGEVGGAEGEQPLPSPPGEPGEQEVAPALLFFQEDFEHGLGGWVQKPVGGCEPTSSQVHQLVTGESQYEPQNHYFEQSIMGGGMDGSDCASLEITRRVELPSPPPGLNLRFKYQVNPFSEPWNQKQGRADLVVTLLDESSRALVTRRFRISCDAFGGGFAGDNPCDPASSQNKDEIVMLNGPGLVTGFQAVDTGLGDISPLLPQTRALEVTLHFDAGFMSQDAWTVMWDDIEVLWQPKAASAEVSRENLQLIQESLGLSEEPGLRDFGFYNEDGAQMFLEALFSASGCSLISYFGPAPGVPPIPATFYCYSALVQPGEAWWESLWRFMGGNTVYAEYDVWAHKGDYLAAWATQLGSEVTIRIIPPDAPPECWQSGNVGSFDNCGEKTKFMGPLSEEGYYKIKWKIPSGLFLSSLGVTVHFDRPLSHCVIDPSNMRIAPVAGYRYCTR